MAQVRALRKCFVENGLREEGDVFEYSGPKNTNVEYLDGAPADDVKAEAPTTTKKWKSAAKRGADVEESQA